MYFVSPTSKASVNISKKFLVGMIILLVSWIGYLTLDVTGHMLDSNKNASIVCLFNSSAATERNGEAMNLTSTGCAFLNCPKLLLITSF